jgi:hypothetical protein
MIYNNNKEINMIRGNEVTCPYCNGGYIITQSDNGPNPVEKKYTCPVCGGSEWMSIDEYYNIKVLGDSSKIANFERETLLTFFDQTEDYPDMEYEDFEALIKIENNHSEMHILDDLDFTSISIESIEKNIITIIDYVGQFGRHYQTQVIERLIKVLEERL